MTHPDRATHFSVPDLSTSPARARRLPWAVVIALPLALMTLMWATTRDIPAAVANGTITTPTYAGCGALNPAPTPNFAIIQEAVSHTAPGGVVNICPGLYDESVNLLLMNGGGSTGDITLRKHPDVAGTVDWTSSSGDALFVDDLFVGDVVLHDLYIHDAAQDGVDFAVIMQSPVHISGSVTISNVRAISNSGIGFYIRATEGITIYDSTADQNGAIGAWLATYAGLNPIIQAQAADYAGGPPIYLSGVQANDNGAAGVEIAQSGTVDIFDSEASYNGAFGFIGFSSSGIMVHPGYYFVQAPSDLSVAGVVDHGDGPYVHIQNTEAISNGGFGFYVLSGAPTIHFTGTTAVENAYDGVAAASIFDTTSDISIFVNNSTADRNGWASQGGFPQDGAIAYGPYAGFRLVAPHITVDGSGADDNSIRGFCLDSGFGAATVTNSTAVNNDQDGFYQEAFSRDIYSCAYVFFAGVAADVDAAGDVVALDTPYPSFVINNSTADDNGDSGVEVASMQTAVTVTNLTAQDNGTGILIRDTRQPDLTVAAISYAPVRIDNSLIQGNSARGVAFEENPFLVAAQAVTTPTAVIAHNIICENGAGLVITETEQLDRAIAADIQPLAIGAVVADARGNWWGDDTGPNPPGSGDTIVKGTGVVSETPWIDTFFSSTVPSPTIPGIPVAVSFRFGDAGQIYFLENGVGNLSEAPLFQISNDNGDIAPAATVAQFLDDTYLSVTVTPTVPGAVNVTVAGPCGLTPSVAVPVADPGVSISKTPDLQGVPVGGEATFTVTVENTGDITLTQVTVDDAVAPGCSRTAGSLADIGPGQQSSYTCTLSVNDSLVNTAQVNAQALVNGQPSGILLGDSDSATVKVGRLTLTRTVWIDGYDPACQTIDKSVAKVPAGTTVKYCFTVTNTGDYTFTRHSLNDSRLGEIFGGFAQDLPPGASYSNVDAGIAATETIAADIAGVTTWTGTLDGPIEEVSVAAATNQVDATVSRAIAVSLPGDDQDADGIDDITEGSGDANGSGVPDFLEFTPTGEAEEDQPGVPKTLLLPSLGR